jgi:nucleoside-diphosphate-sugar epimerase
MTNNRTILITGVTGNQGGAVAQALQGSGFHLRGLTRKPEGERATALARQARIAGRVREAPCVGRDDEARAVSGCARQNRATAGRGDDTTRHRDRLRAPGCGPGLE